VRSQTVFRGIRATTTQQGVAGKLLMRKFSANTRCVSCVYRRRGREAVPWLSRSALYSTESKPAFDFKARLASKFVAAGYEKPKYLQIGNQQEGWQAKVELANGQSFTSGYAKKF